MRVRAACVLMFADQEEKFWAPGARYFVLALAGTPAHADSNPRLRALIAPL